MYAEQVERLRQALGRRRFKRSVKIDTVDSFEGREEDIVVISLVRSNERGHIGFLRVPNRLNVAISRAKRLVACIGDSATLRSGEESMYGQLVEAARSTGGWLNAQELVSAPGHRRPARAPGEGDKVETDEEAATDPSRRRRRRRRRGRRGGPRPAIAAGASGSTATTPPQAGGAAAEGQPATDGAPGDRGPRRRRRRRRRGRGSNIDGNRPVVLPGEVVTGGVSAPPPSGDHPAEPPAAADG